jgi:acetyltransferase-like isoleucine patch superfamily enzyme
MLIANNKPIRIIGYTESSMTKEFLNEINKTHLAEVIAPTNFLNLVDKNIYQYIVSISVDLDERMRIINLVDQHNFDLITVIHDTTILNQELLTSVGCGTFVFPFCNLAHGAQVGRHCIVSSYSLIGHHVTINDNCILRPGVMVTNRSTVGKNCMINIRSTVTNNVTIVDNVEISGCSSVTKDITQPGRYAGTPARRVSDR